MPEWQKRPERAEPMAPDRPARGPPGLGFGMPIKERTPTIRETEEIAEEQLTYLTPEQLELAEAIGYIEEPEIQYQQPTTPEHLKQEPYEETTTRTILTPRGPSQKTFKKYVPFKPVKVKFKFTSAPTRAELMPLTREQRWQRRIREI
jgi:hypothetical protein